MACKDSHKYKQNAATVIVEARLVAAQFLAAPGAKDVRAWAVLQVGGKKLVSTWELLPCQERAVHQLCNTVSLEVCRADAGTMMHISGCVHLGGGTGPVRSFSVEETVTVHPGLPEITLLEARSTTDGSVAAVLVFTLQGHALFPYDEPSSTRRKEVWSEPSFWQKKWSKAAIRSTDLSKVPDAELGQFFQYHLDKRWKEGLNKGAKAIVGLGVGIALSFVDPTGIIVVVTLSGAAYHVIAGVCQQYRTYHKAGHIMDEAKRRGLHLVHDPPTGTWYVARAAKAVVGSNIIDAVATVASLGLA